LEDTPEKKQELKELQEFKEEETGARIQEPGEAGGGSMLANATACFGSNQYLDKASTLLASGPA
jgi:hypothetical protein